MLLLLFFFFFFFFFLSLFSFSLSSQNESIDSILERSVTRTFKAEEGKKGGEEAKGGKGGGSALSKVTYACEGEEEGGEGEGGEGVGLLDEDFWAKIFPNMRTPHQLRKDLAGGKVVSEEECEKFVQAVEAICQVLFPLCRCEIDIDLFLFCFIYF